MLALPIWPLKFVALFGASSAVLAASAVPASAAALLTWASRTAPPPSAQPTDAARQSRRANPDDMVLGEAAPAPLGYLRFCARRPDQCGLEGDAWSSLQAMSPGDRADKLVAKYYWSVAFASGANANLGLSPAAGSGATAAPLPEHGGRFDWSCIFGPTTARVATGANSSGAAQTTAVAQSAFLDLSRLVFDARDAAPSDAGGAAVDMVATSTAGADALLATPVSMKGDASPTQANGSVGPAIFDESGETPSPAAGWAYLSPSAARGEADPASAAPTTNAQAGPSPDEVTPAQADPLIIDRQTSALLDRVNLYVNRSIRFVSDKVQYGVDDVWTLPLDAGGSGAGECKDYVLEKRRALVDAGIPADDLSIAIVKTTWGETHAVLLVATDRGELVMDSLSLQIRPWRQAPYQWIERQAPGRQLDWVKIPPHRWAGF